MGGNANERMTKERPALERTILLVEDDSALRESLGEALRDHG
jgi:CheY-like chemotaxis protein